ncbi:hypothetical protein D3C75_1006230 [compost metagenome]
MQRGPNINWRWTLKKTATAKKNGLERARRLPPAVPLWQWRRTAPPKRKTPSHQRQASTQIKPARHFRQTQTTRICLKVATRTTLSRRENR